MMDKDKIRLAYFTGNNLINNISLLIFLLAIRFFTYRPSRILTKDVQRTSLYSLNILRTFPERLSDKLSVLYRFMASSIAVT